MLSALNGRVVFWLLYQMVWFRENWYEEVLRQLRQALVKCRAVAFENRANVAEASVTPHTLNFVAKLVSTFGVGVENNVASVVTNTFSSAASESLARRAQATAQDPVFQRMKSQFTSDFDFRSNILQFTYWHLVVYCCWRSGIMGVASLYSSVGWLSK